MMKNSQVIWLVLALASWITITVAQTYPIIPNWQTKSCHPVISTPEPGGNGTRHVQNTNMTLGDSVVLKCACYDWSHTFLVWLDDTFTVLPLLPANDALAFGRQVAYVRANFTEIGWHTYTCFGGSKSASVRFHVLPQMTEQPVSVAYAHSCTALVYDPVNRLYIDNGHNFRNTSEPLVTDQLWCGCQQVGGGFQLLNRDMPVWHFTPGQSRVEVSTDAFPAFHSTPNQPQGGYWMTLPVSQSGKYICDAVHGDRVILPSVLAYRYETTVAPLSWTTVRQRTAPPSRPNVVTVTPEDETDSSRRCSPVIFDFAANEIYKNNQEATGRYLRLREQQLMKERTFGCGCQEEQNDERFGRPKWLNVSQESTWAIFNESLQLVSMLRNYTAGQYVCGFDETSQLWMSVAFETAGFVVATPGLGDCWPTITVDEGLVQGQRVIRAVHGRQFGLRCHCMYGKTVDRLQWELDGVALTQEGGVVDYSGLYSADGTVSVLQMQVDFHDIVRTYTCRSNLKNDSVQFQALAGTQVVELLHKSHKTVVGKSRVITCVSGGGLPVPNLSLSLVRGNITRPLIEDSSNITYISTGNFVTVKLDVAFTPEWSDNGWFIQCKSSSHDPLWEKVVDGVVPSHTPHGLNTDESDEDQDQDVLVALSPYPEDKTDRILIDSQRDNLYRSKCTPEIIQDYDYQELNLPTRQVIQVNDTSKVTLRCHCIEEHLSGASALHWTLRDYDPPQELSGTIMGVTVTASRYDTQPTYICNGLGAEPAEVTLDVYSPVERVHVVNQNPRFVNGVGQNMTCSTDASNPPPRFRFWLVSPNLTVESIPDRELTTYSQLNTFQWAPSLISSATFRFVPLPEHDGGLVVCAASHNDTFLDTLDIIEVGRKMGIEDEETLQMALSLDMEPPRFMGAVQIKVVNGTPPVITSFYTVPRQPRIGEKFKFYCMVDTDGPLWNVRAMREFNGFNLSLPVVSNHNVLLREEEFEEMGAVQTATLEYIGRYRCRAWSIFGNAEDVFYELVVQSPPLVEFSHLSRSVTKVQVALGSFYQLRVNITSYPNWTKVECWRSDSAVSRSASEMVQDVELEVSKVQGIYTIASFGSDSYRYFTCRALNIFGWSALAQVRLEKSPREYRENSAYQFQTNRLSNGDTNLTVALTFADFFYLRTVVACPIVGNRTQDNECMINSTKNGFYSSNHSFIFSAKERRDWRLEVTQLIGDETSYFSIPLPSSTIRGPTHAYYHHNGHGSLTGPVVTLTLLGVLAFVALSSLIVVLSRYSSQLRKQNAIVNRVLTSNRFSQVHKSRRNKDNKQHRIPILDNIEVQEDDPVVTVVPDRTTKLINGHSLS